MEYLRKQSTASERKPQVGASAEDERIAKCGTPDLPKGRKAPEK